MYKDAFMLSFYLQYMIIYFSFYLFLLMLYFI